MNRCSLVIDSAEQLLQIVRQRKYGHLLGEEVNWVRLELLHEPIVGQIQALAVQDQDLDVVLAFLLEALEMFMCVYLGLMDLLDARDIGLKLLNLPFLLFEFVDLGLQSLL